MKDEQLVWDIECDELLVKAKKCHCLVIKNRKNGRVTRYKGKTLLKGWKRLCEAKVIIGHNIVMYDIPVLARILKRNRNEIKAQIYDTILMSRLRYPDRVINPVGGHTLKDWGLYLIGKGVLKRGKEESPVDWSKWTKKMEDYCVQDVEVSLAVFNWLIKKLDGSWQESSQLEHEVASIITYLLERGWNFNDKAGMKFLGQLQTEKCKAEDKLREFFPDKVLELSTPAYYFLEHDGVRYQEKNKGLLSKKWTKAMGIKKSEWVELIQAGPNRTKNIPFNPGSTKQIADRFLSKYGWEAPLTKKGNPTIDEKIMETLDFEEVPYLQQWETVQDRIEKCTSWLENQHDDGRIYHSIITNGTVTGRMSHSSPNLGQVPRVGKPYGEESRSCFIASPKWFAVGTDASGLEGRLMGHFLHRFDGGQFIRLILDGDLHQHNADLLKLSRDDAKTWFYAWAYGAFDAKLGLIGNKGLSKSKAYKVGEDRRRRFEKGMSGVKDLLSWLEHQVESQGYLIGLDGRKVPIRSTRVAFNTLCQHAGAIVMKRALVNRWPVINEKYEHNVDWGMCGNIHDEFQDEARTKTIAKFVGEQSVLAIVKAGEQLQLNCPMDGEYKIGKNWKETH